MDTSVDQNNEHETPVELKYGRTSMARTLMTRLPRLFRTRTLVPWKKSNSCRLGIIKANFLKYIENGIWCVLIRIASMRRF